MISGPSPRPPWHRWVYALLAVIAAAFLYLLLDQLTDRVVRAEDSANTARVAAGRLAEQVEGLGGTPVVDPDSLPTPEQGAPGVDGRDGLAGLDGAQGPQGLRGAQGPRGLTGATGEPGASGQDGADGAAGADGSDGANGQDGASIVGETGSVGATGPQGATGDRGPQGERGEQGERGPEGPAGATTCPEGYTAEERAVTSVEEPLGEPAIVCVRDEEPEQ